MKNNTLLITSCLLFLLSACTVNKRTHRPGYNVEWHSANPEPKKHPKLEEQERSIEEQMTLEMERIEIEEINPKKIEIAGLDEFQGDNTMAGGISPVGFLNTKVHLGAESWKRHWDKELSPTDISRDAKEQDNSNREMLALKGFWFSLSGLIVGIVLTFISISTLSGLAGVLLAVIPPVLLILGIVYSNKSLKQYKEKPGSNFRRGFAKAGKVIGISGIFIWLIMLFAYSISVLVF